MSFWKPGKHPRSACQDDPVVSGAARTGMGISGRRIAGEDRTASVLTDQDHVISLTLCLWSHSR